VDVQITAFVFFIFRSVGEGEGGLRLTLLDYFITKKQTATQLYCQIPSNLVLQYSFDSGYSLVVFGKDILSGGRGERVRKYIFFLQNNFPLFYYHKNN
jgi:hypothetical protein